MLRPRCQARIKIKPLWPPEGSAAPPRAAGARRRGGAGGDECIAVKRDLWFEGFDPHPPMPGKD
jgi:hypothetical protein